MTKRQDDTPTGGSPAEVVDISAGQSDGGGTLNPPSAVPWQPNPTPRHPDFEPGNELGLIHGAYSERAIAERAQLVHASLLEVAPWCAEDRYVPSVNRYLQATARETLAHEALMAAGSKFSTRLLETATAAARLAWQMGDALGLTPAGHARLKLLVAGATEAEMSLADLAAEGRAIRTGRTDLGDDDDAA